MAPVTSGPPSLSAQHRISPPLPSVFRFLLESPTSCDIQKAGTKPASSVAMNRSTGGCLSPCCRWPSATSPLDFSSVSSHWPHRCVSFRPVIAAVRTVLVYLLLLLLFLFVLATLSFLSVKPHVFSVAPPSPLPSSLFQSLFLHSANAPLVASAVQQGKAQGAFSFISSGPQRANALRKVLEGDLFVLGVEAANGVVSDNQIVIPSWARQGTGYQSLFTLRLSTTDSRTFVYYGSGALTASLQQNLAVFDVDQRRSLLEGKLHIFTLSALLGCNAVSRSASFRLSTNSGGALDAVSHNGNYRDTYRSDSCRVSPLATHLTARAAFGTGGSTFCYGNAFNVRYYTSPTPTAYDVNVLDVDGDATMFGCVWPKAAGSSSALRVTSDATTSNVVQHHSLFYFKEAIERGDIVSVASYVRQSGTTQLQLMFSSGSPSVRPSTIPFTEAPVESDVTTGNKRTVSYRIPQAANWLRFTLFGAGTVGSLSLVFENDPVTPTATASTSLPPTLTIEPTKTLEPTATPSTHPTSSATTTPTPAVSASTTRSLSATVAPTQSATGSRSRMTQSQTARATISVSGSQTATRRTRSIVVSPSQGTLTSTWSGAAPSATWSASGTLVLSTTRTQLSTATGSLSRTRSMFTMSVSNIASSTWTSSLSVSTSLNTRTMERSASTSRSLSRSQGTETGLLTVSASIAKTNTGTRSMLTSSSTIQLPLAVPRSTVQIIAEDGGRIGVVGAGTVAAIVGVAGGGALTLQRVAALAAFCEPFDADEAPGIIDHPMRFPVGAGTVRWPLGSAAGAILLFAAVWLFTLAAACAKAKMSPSPSFSPAAAEIVQEAQGRRGAGTSRARVPSPEESTSDREMKSKHRSASDVARPNSCEPTATSTTHRTATGEATQFHFAVMAGLDLPDDPLQALLSERLTAEPTAVVETTQHLQNNGRREIDGEAVGLDRQLSFSFSEFGASSKSDQTEGNSAPGEVMIESAHTSENDGQLTSHPQTQAGHGAATRTPTGPSLRQKSMKIVASVFVASGSIHAVPIATAAYTVIAPMALTPAIIVAVHSDAVIDRVIGSLLAFAVVAFPPIVGIIARKICTGRIRFTLRKPSSSFFMERRRRIAASLAAAKHSALKTLMAGRHLHTRGAKTGAEENDHEMVPVSGVDPLRQPPAGGAEGSLHGGPLPCLEVPLISATDHDLEIEMVERAREMEGRLDETFGEVMSSAPTEPTPTTELLPTATGDGAPALIDVSDLIQMGLSAPAGHSLQGDDVNDEPLVFDLDSGTDDSSVIEFTLDEAKNAEDAAGAASTNAPNVQVVAAKKRSAAGKRAWRALWKSSGKWTDVAPTCPKRTGEVPSKEVAQGVQTTAANPSHGGAAPMNTWSRMKHFGALFAAYRSPFAWFLLFETYSALAVSALSALSTADVSWACVAAEVAAVVGAAVLIIAVLVLRPYTVRADTIISLVSAGLELLAAGLRASGIETDIVAVVLLCLACVAILQIVTTAVRRLVMLARRRRKRQLIIKRHRQEAHGNPSDQEEKTSQKHGDATVTCGKQHSTPLVALDGSGAEFNEGVTMEESVGFDIDGIVPGDQPIDLSFLDAAGRDDEAALCFDVGPNDNAGDDDDEHDTGLDPHGERGVPKEPLVVDPQHGRADSPAGSYNSDISGQDGGLCVSDQPGEHGDVGGEHDGDDDALEFDSDGNVIVRPRGAKRHRTAHLAELEAMLRFK